MHDVALFKRTEAFQGAVDFYGFVPGAGGALVATVPAVTRRIEVIGDSISAGYGNEGPDQNCHFTPDTENAYLAYGALAGCVIHAVRLLRGTRKDRIPRAVVTLIAGISLLDAVLIARSGAPGAAGAAALAMMGFPLTLAMQRVVRGT